LGFKGQTWRRGALAVEPRIDIGFRLRFGVRRDFSVVNAEPMCGQGLAPLWIAHNIPNLRGLRRNDYGMITGPLSCHARAADALATFYRFKTRDMSLMNSVSSNRHGIEEPRAIQSGATNRTALASHLPPFNRAALKNASELASA